VKRHAVSSSASLLTASSSVSPIKMARRLVGPDAVQCLLLDEQESAGAFDHRSDGDVRLPCGGHRRRARLRACGPAELSRKVAILSAAVNATVGASGHHPRAAAVGQDTVEREGNRNEDRSAR
jgi:hypothetical protein